MKKIYSTCALLLSCGMAFAVAPQANNMQLQKIDLTARSTQFVKPEMKASAATRAGETVDGVYKMLYLMMDENPSAPPLAFQSDLRVVTTSGNNVEIQGLDWWDGNDAIAGTVDYTNGTITVPANQVIGQYEHKGTEAETGLAAGTYNVVWTHFVPGDDGYLKVSMDPFVGTIINDSELGDSEVLGANGIYFNFNDYWYLGLQDMGAMGFNLLFFGASLPYRPATLNNEGWTDFGTAEVYEGWLSSCLAEEANRPAAYTVNVQKSVEDSNIIRLVNPYGDNTPYAELNNSEAAGQILFDISNPECVKIKQVSEEVLFNLQYSDGGTLDITGLEGVYSGFFNSADLGMNAFYPGDLDGLYYYSYGFDDEDILDYTDAEERSVLADGIITIETPIFWVSDTFESDRFPIAGYATTIKFSELAGVNTISFDDNAPVEYYNLQGMKVAQPKAGELVIARQGNKAVKMIAK